MREIKEKTGELRGKIAIADYISKVENAADRDDRLLSYHFRSNLPLRVHTDFIYK